MPPTIFIDQMLHQSEPADSSRDAIGHLNFENMHPVGWHTAHIAEATDCAYADPPLNCTTLDGESGDTGYPFGTIKVLATVGEYNKKTGHMLVGVPDGMGSYLVDEETVRIVWQSESYGPIYGGQSWPFIVNCNGATFTGSHVMVRPGFPCSAISRLALSHVSPLSQPALPSSIPIRPPHLPAAPLACPHTAD